MIRERYAELATVYGTPLYVHDGDRIERQYRLLRSWLPSTWEVFYSLKSNPLLGICQLLRQLGSSVEAASGGEMHLAFQAGFRPDKMIFTSPGKTPAELTAAIRQRIYSINVESVEEARLVNELAMQLGAAPVKIAVRIHPDFPQSGAGLKMTGVPTQFGIDEADIDEALAAIGELPYVQLIGFHVFTGSQVLDAEQLVRGMEEVMKLALRLTERHRLDLAFLDLGGGFGIPYFPGEKPLDGDRMREGIAELWSRYADRLHGVRIGVESGRFLTAEAGEYVTRVLYVKHCKGAKFAICDGGSNFHASSAFLGRYVRNNFPMFLLGKEGEPTAETNVVGCLCTPTDVLGQKVQLADAAPGDLLVVEKSGAYGLTHSPVLFLSHALPAEILVYGADVHILRERGRAEDFLRGQRPLHGRESYRGDYVHSI